MGRQANTSTQATTRADGRLPDVSVAAGRKGFKAVAPLAIGTREWQGTYPARPRHVQDARHAVGQFLSGCAAADDTLLICSELATNALLHSRSGDGGEFILRVEVHLDCIWVECEDAGGPWQARPDDGRPHGLDVVHGLCGEGGWGVGDLSSGRAGRRVVWARLELNGSRL
jgi:anti-sigma regulatory factor (Ser/Thr protein kinase)